MLSATVHTMQRQRVLKARVALTLYSEYGYVPKEEDVERAYHLIRVLYRDVLGPYLIEAAKAERITSAFLIQ
jgi:hypothetical protein